MAEKHNQSKEKKQIKSLGKRLIEIMKGSSAEVSVAFISTILVTLLSFLFEATSFVSLIENSFADWIRPFITITLSVFTLVFALLIITYGALRLSSYRRIERLQNVLNLMEKEVDFFGNIEKDISILIQER